MKTYYYIDTDNQIIEFMSKSICNAVTAVNSGRSSKFLKVCISYSTALKYTRNTGVM